MDDILIRGGEVIDGSGTPGCVADIVVTGGRIMAVGNDHTWQARRIIDATGQVVAPGFIDIHTHSDFTLPLNPRAESKIRQGVTTEVLGNCGFSAAPALPGRVEMLRDYLAASAPWLEFRQTTFADYMNTFPATSVNTVMQVGHNTLRLLTMGMEDRPPRPDELSLMQHLLEEALDAGALGLSSGLFTAPGIFAKTQEMIALGQVLHRHGAGYASHIRDEANHVFEAVRETIAIGEACGIHVQIAHLKLSGTDNWGGAARLLTEIESARQRGVQIDCDQYPYTAGSNPLRNLLPTWVQEGSMETMLQRLSQPQIRSRLREELAAHGLNNFGRIPSWASPSRRTRRNTPDAPSATSPATVAVTLWMPSVTTSSPTAATPASSSPPWPRRMCARSYVRPWCWWAPMAPRWRRTGPPGRANRTHASMAPSPGCWVTMPVSWGCCPGRRRSTK
jgi:N-acyl-D-amino-acid deacylase